MLSLTAGMAAGSCVVTTAGEATSVVVGVDGGLLVLVAVGVGGRVDPGVEGSEDGLGIEGRVTFSLCRSEVGRYEASCFRLL